MILRTLLLACLLATCRAQQPGQGQQPNPTQLQRVEAVLQPFGTVQTCLPLNILIQPNATSDTYGLILEAEPAVLQALSYNVSRGDRLGATDNILQLETNASFATSQPVRVIVTMPQGALQAVEHSGPGGEVFVAPGFNVPSFTATAAFGAGRLYINNLVAPQATLRISGTGDAILAGSFGSVNVTSTGSGAIYVVGANDTVTLDLRGVSNAYIQPAQPTTAITGSAQGINTVQYTSGTCRMSSTFPFFQICQSVPFIALPAPAPVWTCGVQLQGNFTCSDQGTAFAVRGGFAGASGALGSTPVTTTAPLGTAEVSPTSFNFAGASPAGPGTGVQQQAGSVSPSGTTASSNIAGTGSVSASSVAGPGGAQTQTTQGGQSTGFQAGGGQGTTGGTTGGTQLQGGMAGGATSSASAGSSSTAFSTASPASATAAASSTPSSQPSQVSSGVYRVGPDGQQAAATSQQCQAPAPELRMPIQGTA